MSGNFFYIVSKMHGKVVTGKGGSKRPGTQCIVMPKKPVDEADNQLFYECPHTNTIRYKANTKLCLDVYDGKYMCLRWSLKQNGKNVSFIYI